MRVHIADTCKSLKWKPYDVDWKQFVKEKLSQPTVTSEKFEVYKSLHKDEKTMFKDCGGYIFGNLQKNSRSKKDVISRNALLLDLDFAHLNIWDDIIRIFRFEMVLHSTHSHESAEPRYRLIVPLSRDCTPDEYECVARTVAYYIGIEYFDKTTFQRNRLMYFPSVSQDGEWVFKWQEGDFLNPDSILLTYVDWRDMLQWPYHPDERKIIHELSGSERQDPNTLGGAIGAFNRCYSISKAIETFLSDKYVHAQGDRYTYIPGTSAMGAVCYDDKWLYSNHSTDPACERLMSSFELCMCHLHDDNLKEAVKWASNLPEVKKSLLLENFQNVTDGPDNTASPDLMADWYSLLELDKEGLIKGNDRNVRLIFDNDKNLAGLYKYNELRNDINLSRSAPWRTGIGIEGAPIRNIDFPCLRTYMGLKYRLTCRSIIDEMTQAIAFEMRYHPVKQYITSIIWDGIPRVETTLIDYFAAEDNVYTREVFKRFLIGAILRVFSPGIKHDYIFVLVGKEGTAKSEFLKRLGGAWFSDTFAMHSDKAVYEQLQGKWIIEAAEIDRLSRTEVSEVKNFASKRVDSFRVAYGHVVEDFPRQCVIAGTTNEDDFLKSETGNRRFYPVTVRNGMLERGEHISSKYVWDDLTQYEVDQLWAEAYMLALCGETNQLSKESVRVIDSKICEYEEQNVIAGEIDKQLLTLVPNDYENMTFEDAVNWWRLPEIRTEGVKYMDYVSGVQLWCEILGRPREAYNRLQSLEMRSAIRKSNIIDSDNSERINTPRYGRQRCYKLKIKA